MALSLAEGVGVAAGVRYGKRLGKAAPLDPQDMADGVVRVESVVVNEVKRPQAGLGQPHRDFAYVQRRTKDGMSKPEIIAA